MIARSERALARARIDRQSVVLLVFDLDHFKAINDRFGHSVGDKALGAFADIACRAIRANDPFGRIGGEEFAALLVGATAATGYHVAERIRRDFAEATIDGARLPTTVSIGVAAVTAAEAVSFDALLTRADAALYSAKRAGRDRVVSALALAG
jgi:diguanylate cyclase (GGDEF)-like protein